MKRTIMAAAMVAVAAQISFALPSQASSLVGTWSGTGTAKQANGPREKVRCRITYSKVTAKLYKVRSVCASTSTRVTHTGEVLQSSPTRFAGDFYVPSFDVTGRVRVRLNGSRQTVSFTSTAGSGTVTLTRR